MEAASGSESDADTSLIPAQRRDRGRARSVLHILVDSFFDTRASRKTRYVNIVTAMRERVERISACGSLDVEASALPERAGELTDDVLLSTMRDLAALANDATRLQAVLAGVAAHRSRREDGHAGLAATLGHASPVALIQAVTGGTKADASRQVRVGESLLGVSGARGEGAATTADLKSDDLVPPWRRSLRQALLEGTLTTAQHDAIRAGLGEPPTGDDERVHEAWALAAEGLIDEAGSLAVEELAKRSRTMRDLLDPTGAESRSARRYEGREFRMWIDAEGQHRARIAFDDEMALWLRTVRDSALRPRRGGPRFVTADERAAADELAGDPRSNEQLEYDLVMDLIRAGALASHEDVFGARQPGVRMIVVKDVVGPRDPLGRLLAVGHAEDGGDALAGSIIDRALCMHGSRIVTTDGHGNPLDVGREQRLYTARQRIALAARDGGCLWPECNRPASSCEAHHCDHFGEHGGRTDIDRGVLLCRFHHMLLHNRGWRITRDGHGPFILHPPPGEGSPRALVSKAAWRWAWDPPPPAERGGWRHPDVAREPAGARPG